jgi:hypothetical protein
VVDVWNDDGDRDSGVGRGNDRVGRGDDREWGQQEGVDKRMEMTRGQGDRDKGEKMGDCTNA